MPSALLQWNGQVSQCSAFALLVDAMKWPTRTHVPHFCVEDYEAKCSSSMEWASCTMDAMK